MCCLPTKALQTPSGGGTSKVVPSVSIPTLQSRVGMDEAPYKVGALHRGRQEKLVNRSFVFIQNCIRIFSLQKVQIRYYKKFHISFPILPKEVPTSLPLLSVFGTVVGKLPALQESLPLLWRK